MFSTEAEVPADWVPVPGDVVLDTYEVRGLLGAGGMGSVYRVHHRGWDLDLAVKSPHRGVEGFAAEAGAWVDLGLHPHVVTCHYVRDLGGVPRVFAELVDGGSLAEWIASGRLYEGPEDEVVARILDVAFQFAWGLGHAHERGLVHQDVKPANVLLTADGVAKVTDFGLSVGLPIELDSVSEGTIVVAGAGGTVAYFSPEQAEAIAQGQAGVPVRERTPLTRRTDVWSWAVSVLDMFDGQDHPQRPGQAALAVLERYLADGPVREGVPAMPEALVELLRECFEQNPDARPHDFDQITSRLTDIYQDATGGPYLRERPTAAELLADQLNNKALSLVDLDRDDEADALFNEALAADPHHLEATYNQGLRRWRRGEITDLDLVAQLEAVRASHPDEWRGDYLLALVHIERGDPDAALAALDQAHLHAEDAPELRAAKAMIRKGAKAWCDPRGPLLGHTGRVLAVAVLPEGRRAVSAGKDGSVRVWDVEARETVWNLAGIGGQITSVAALPDGRRVVSGGGDGFVRVWDVEAGQSMWALKGHAGAVTSVAALPDGRSVISGGNDGSVQVWDAETGQAVGTFEGHVGAVTSVATCPDGRRLLSAGVDGTVRVWDKASGNQMSTLQGHVGAVLSVAASPDGRLVVSGGEDRTIRVWDADSTALALTLRGHTSAVLSVAVSTDGNQLVSGGSDRTVRIWETASGTLLRTLVGHTEAVKGVALWPDANLAVSAGDDLTVRTWKLGFGPKGTFALSRPRAGKDVAETEARMRAALSDAHRALAAGRSQEAALIAAGARELSGFRRSVELLDVLASAGLHGCRSALAGAWQTGALEGHTGRVTTVAAGLDGPAVVSGAEDGTVRFWDTSSGKALHSTLNNRGGIRAVAVANDGHRVVFAGDEGTVALWDSTKVKAPLRMDGHTGAVHAVAIAPNGRWLASGGDDLTVRLWDAASGELLRMLEGHSDTVRVLAAAPDGRRLVSGGDDETLRFWEIESGASVRTIETHTEWVSPQINPRDGRVVEPRRGPRHHAGVWAATMSFDGRVVVTGSAVGQVRVWSAQSGELLQTLEGHEGAVTGAAMTPDGRWLVSAAVDGTVLVWDLVSGVAIRMLRGHAGPVNAVAIGPEGRRVVSGGDDGTIRTWELDWEYQFPDPSNWDERARPYLKNFLNMHAPIPSSSRRLDLDSTSARPTRPWSEADFDRLLVDLSRSGFGWLQTAGVRAALLEMTAQRDRNVR